METSNEATDTLITAEPIEKLSTYMDPKNDYAFRRLFGTKRFERVTIGLLNDCLGKTGKEKIDWIEFLPTAMEPDIDGKKKCIVDVLCHDIEGSRFVVEMQCKNQTAFMKRIQFYGAKAYTNQLAQAEKYEELQKVAMVVIADFEPFPHKENYKTIHRILDIHTYENDLNGIEYIFISLAKLKEKLSKLSKEELKNLTPIEKWCYFFIYAVEVEKEELVMALTEKDEIIKEAFEASRRSLWTEEELRGYDLEERNRRDQEAITDFAYREGRTEGKAEGLAEGEAKGRAEGEAKLIKAIKNFLVLGLDTNAIASATGLDLSQIEALKREIAAGSNSPVFF